MGGSAGRRRAVGLPLSTIVLATGATPPTERGGRSTRTRRPCSAVSHGRSRTRVSPGRRLARSRPRSRSFPHSRAASSSSCRASSVRPSRVSSSPRTLGQQVRAGQPAGRHQVVDDRQCGRRPRRPSRPRPPVELDDRRRRQPAERLVEQHDPVPVRLVHGGRDRVALGDRGLQRRTAPEPAADPPGPRQRRAAAADRRPVPAPSVLAARAAPASPSLADPGREPRRGELQEGEQPVRLGLVRHQPGHDAGQPHRLAGQVRPDPLRRPSVADRPLGEDQVDHAQHRAEAFAALLGRRHLERHPRGRERLLGARDPGLHGGGRHQERPRDLVARQARRRPAA